MAKGPDAGTITVRQTLDLLDGDFRDLADGVADSRYAFWLGSGISLSRFPGLKELVEQVLEFLRDRAEPGDKNGAYLQALERAFAIAVLSDDERNQIDLSQPANAWPVIDALKQRLTNLYATFLDIDIDGEDDDVLIWEGVDVVGTYADPNIEPDAEHLALAILVKEGLVTELASANWDGLIERAVEEINGGECAIDVCVKSEDLQQPQHRAKLLKFHGCAVRAGKNEAKYRSYIVGRSTQVDFWRDDPKMQGLVQHLVTVVMENPTLMLGLSAQDFNVRGVFGRAQNLLEWDWPGERPACVFAGNELGEGQRGLLGNVYRTQYQGEQRIAIQNGALIKAYAKPLLVALILYATAAKLKRLAELSTIDDSDETVDWIEAGLKQLRNYIAENLTGDAVGIVNSIVLHLTRTKMLFLEGRPPDNPKRYEPVTDAAVRNIEDTPLMRNSGLPEAAVSAAIIGAGIKLGDWQVGAPDQNDTTSGIAVLKTPVGESRLFIVASAHVEHELLASGRVREGDNAIIIHAKPIYDRMQRSPKRRFGRTGAARVRRTSIKTLITETEGPEALMERFKLEAMP